MRSISNSVIHLWSCTNSAIESNLRESMRPPNQIFKCFFIFFIYKFHVVKLFKNTFPKFQNSRFRTHCDTQLCCAQPLYSFHLQGKISVKPNQLGRICTHSSIYIEVLSNIGICIHISGEKPAPDLSANLASVTCGCARLAGVTQHFWHLLPTFSRELRLAHSKHYFFSFQRRSMKQSAFCRGMWSLQIPEGKF